MSEAKAVVAEVAHDFQDVWRINLVVTFPPGTKGFMPDFLHRLGHQPWTSGILITETPRSMVVMVRGRPWVQVGDIIPITVTE